MGKNQSIQKNNEAILQELGQHSENKNIIKILDMIKKKKKEYEGLVYYANDKYSHVYLANKNKGNQKVCLVITQQEDYSMIKSNKYMQYDIIENSLFLEDTSKIIKSFLLKYSNNSKVNCSCLTKKPFSTLNYYVQEVNLKEYSKEIKEKAKLKITTLSDLKNNHHLVQQLSVALSEPEKPFQWVQWSQQITSEIPKCINLEFLSLIFKQFSLDFKTDINELFQMYRNNVIGKTFMEQLGIGIASCSNLIHIKLIFELWVNISLKDICTFLQFLTQCAKLLKLFINLRNIKIKNEGLEQICQEVSKIIQIKQFQIILENCSFNAQGAKHFEQIFIKCKNLSIVSIDLKRNDLQDAGVLSIGQCIHKCQNLAHLKLNLYSNSLLCDSSIGLSYAIKNKNLISLSLNLGINLLEDRGIIQLIIAISNITGLKKLILILSYNNLSAEGAITFGKHLIKLRNLEYLKLGLDWNSIQNEGIQSLIQDIKQISHLYFLYLELVQNQIDEKILKKLIKRVKKFKRIITHEIKYNIFD